MSILIFTLTAFLLVIGILHKLVASSEKKFLIMMFHLPVQVCLETW